MKIDNLLPCEYIEEKINILIIVITLNFVIPF